MTINLHKDSMALIERQRKSNPALKGLSFEESACFLQDIGIEFKDPKGEIVIILDDDMEEALTKVAEEYNLKDIKEAARWLLKERANIQDPLNNFSVQSFDEYID